MNHLRAFLFDASHADGQILVDSIYEQWNLGNSVCVINKNLPSSMLDRAILKSDPSEVEDVDGSIKKRDLAIVETPDLAVVALTSGTTSNPKPVELSFSAMKSSSESLYRLANIEKDAKWLCVLPPYYIAGMSVIARSWVNEQPVIFRNKFDVQDVKILLDSGTIDAISLVPQQLQQLIDQSIDLSKLQCVLVGGSSIDPNLQNQIKEMSNVHVTYGLTETFGGICLDHKLFDNTQVKIIDEQIFIKSESTMSGYRHNFQLTSERLSPEGWFSTRDLGSYDNSNLIVNGRIDDLINSGGVKIEPQIIEKALYSAGYTDSIVIGTSHETLGQCVTVVNPTDTEIKNINELRNLLSMDLPTTHLPIRIAYSTKFYGNSHSKVNRKELANSCKIIEEYKLEK